MIAQSRVHSVDILRGIVIVLMALGHSRHFFLIYDFAPTNLSFTNPPLFFTRWITNFCAPVFVFLAGVSIHLVLARNGDLKAISKLLIKRGLWLIFLELTVLTFFWNTHFSVIQLQVIWIIGVAFLFMSFLIYLPKTVNLVLAITIILFHNLLDLIDPENLSETWGIIMTFLHIPGDLILSESIRINVLYSILPYLGIILLGYGMGGVFTLDRRTSRRIFIRLGTIMVFFFFVLRGFNIYGDPDFWTVQERGIAYSVMSFLNVTKYPPSLLFVLSTLGPALIILPLLEDKMNTWMKGFSGIGQVAMFFYLMHIPFIRVCAKIYHLFFTNNPRFIMFYILWLGMLLVLFKISMLFRSYKVQKKHDPKYWWLKYI